METLNATAKVSEDGKLTLAVPDYLRGAIVEIKATVRRKKRDDEPRDEHGWPIGFWESVAGSITDPNFKRYPQGEAGPPPSFE